MTGYVKNCEITSKEDSIDAMFITKNGDVICQLDGYVILPKEKMVALLRSWGGVSAIFFLVGIIIGTLVMRL